MKIVVAPDKFKGSLTAIEAASAITSGIRHVLPSAKIVEFPIADGGEGTAQVLVTATRGHFFRRRVMGPLGAPVMAKFGVLGCMHHGGRTAVVEAAEASGYRLVPPEKRNPLVTTTYGTGQLIRAAMELGCTKIIVAIGGSATSDAGAGMAQALGWRLFDANGHNIGFGGGELAKLARIEQPQENKRMGECGKARLKIRALKCSGTVLVACDVKNPLYGKTGASYVYGPQKGATPAMIRRLDWNLRHFTTSTDHTAGWAIKVLHGLLQD